MAVEAARPVRPDPGMTHNLGGQPGDCVSFVSFVSVVGSQPNA